MWQLSEFFSLRVPGGVLAGGGGEGRTSYLQDWGDGGDRVKTEENPAAVENTREEGLWNSLAQGISFC